MPLPVIPGVLRITAAGVVTGGGRWSNTWHARNDSLIDFTEAAIVAFHDNFKLIYTGAAIGLGQAQDTLWYTGTELESISYTPLDGTSGAFVIPTPAPGVQTGASLPAEVCEVVTVRTAARGRQNRGRIFLPAWATSSNTINGVMLPASMAQTLIQINGVQAAIITGGAHLGVGSYGPYLGAGSPHFTPANSFTMDGLFDVQRSRKN